MTESSPSFDHAHEPARRLAQLHAQRFKRDLVVSESCAWILGAYGETCAVPRDAVEALHVAVAALAGAGDDDAALTYLESHLADGDAGRLLDSACHRMGSRCADRLTEIAHRHPGRAFAGRMLATVSEPERLLALLPQTPARSANAIDTVAELVIRGRDEGQRITAAERAWERIATVEPTHSHAYRDTSLRIAAREDLERALDKLREFGDEWGRTEIEDGARAVLDRLVQSDPERATHVVTESQDPRDRVAWLEALAWWFELPVAAGAVVDALLDIGDDQLDLSVAAILVGANDDERLARVGQRLVSRLADGALDAHQIARALAPKVYQLARAERRDDVERGRELVLSCLGDSGSAEEGKASDVFEVLAAPIPAFVPWGSGPGLP